MCITILLEALSLIIVEIFQELGMSQSESSKLISVIGDNTWTVPTSASINRGNPLPGGRRPSSGGYRGFLPNGYQQPLSNCSRNSRASSMGTNEIFSRMIPTPGYSYRNNVLFRNMDDSDYDSGSAIAQSTIGSEQPLQKKQMTGRNNSIYYDSASRSGNGILANLHPKCYGLTKGGIIGADGYGMCSADLTGPRNLHISLTSEQLITSTRDLNQLGSQAPLKSGSHMPSKFLHTGSAIQTLRARYQPMDAPQYMNFSPSLLSKEHQFSSRKAKPFKQHACLFEQQSAHHDDKQKDHLWLKNDFEVQSQSASDLGIQTGRHVMMYANDASPQALGIQAGRHVMMHVNDAPSPHALEELPLGLLNQLHQTSVQEYAPDSRAIPLSFAQTCICSNDPAFRSGNTNPVTKFRSQQQWLLFLRHAGACKAPEGKCPETNCLGVQKLLTHMKKCNTSLCPYPYCHDSRILINHYKNCHDPCPVCIPVRSYLQSQFNASLRSYCTSLPFPARESYGPNERGQSSIKMASTFSSIGVSGEPCGRRIKTDSIHSTYTCSQPSFHDALNRNYLPDETYQTLKCDVSEVKLEVSVSSKPDFDGVKKEKADAVCDLNPSGQEKISNDVLEVVKLGQMESEDTNLVKHESVTPDSEYSEIESGKANVKVVSLIELFTPEQIKAHIAALREWGGKHNKIKVEKNKTIERAMCESSCQLCGVQKLTFEPPSIYCTLCGTRIKRNVMCYTVGNGGAQQYFCFPCYSGSQEDSIFVDGTSIQKSSLERKKNDEETEEPWVQCDKCHAWQHQICALFNGRRNIGGQAAYICANCHIEEIENGGRKPLPQSAILGAKDLPKTILSDHIEHRLFKKLKHERQERAKLHGTRYEEVPGAEALVVRVVSSVDKKLQVKPMFREIFHKEKYPVEFPYKSKVILLFQKIEGVEICLFGMYVQEFGTECEFPNHRHVYISYLDSVKYFRPEIKAVTGEALRTFVYHEILIAYLDYCKIRGFTSCYIWACPPLKGEDYILHCHPEIQKTPKADKLRDWYLSMLRKAVKEQIVVDLTNLYNQFFIPAGECKAKVTAARLPYFDGDYWPGAAEDIIYRLHQAEYCRRQNRKGSTWKTGITMAPKASYQFDLSEDASKDLLLMRKLGAAIAPMKRDFIMVHLHYACTHCCYPMVIGARWICSLCKNFQLCEKCYVAEQKRDEGERHPVNQREKHPLHPVEINDVPFDTKDKDEILESEFFDTRYAFLGLCQENNYQFDNIRRAKHSSMMVLYHLHTPTSAFVTCDVCHLDIENGQGWHCEICVDYNVCNDCYEKGGCKAHPHELSNISFMDDRDAQNKEARRLRVTQVRKMLDLLVHASHCRLTQCQYPNCRRLKGLFRHGSQCETRASGGCILCQKMWYILQLHSRACKEATCNIPRCRELKEHARRLQQQSDCRRRAAVVEMMSQRAAEVAGSTS